MHAEAHIATHVRTTAHLDTTPAVYIGGMPYLAALKSKEIPFLSVTAQDVEVPNLGMITASTSLRDITVTPAQLWSGDFDGAKVSTLSRSISLDGVALGRLLNISDLSITHPENMSPSGGPSAEAQLTGTLPGDATPTTVFVNLRLSGEQFFMTPTTAPTPEAAAAFTLNFDTRDLPLPAQATMVSLRGGSIIFEVQRRNIALNLQQLSPLDCDA